MKIKTQQNINLLFDYDRKAIESFFDPFSDVNLLCLLDVMIEISLSERTTHYPLLHGPAAKVDHHKQKVPKGLAKRGLKLNDYNRIRIIAAATLAHYLPSDTQKPIVRYVASHKDADSIYAEILDDDKFATLMKQMRDEWRERKLAQGHQEIPIKDYDHDKGIIYFDGQREPYTLRKGMLPHTVMGQLYESKNEVVTKKVLCFACKVKTDYEGSKKIDRAIYQLRIAIGDQDEHGTIETTNNGYILHC